VAETVFSTLHAPMQMLWHSQFVVTILLGRGVHWGPQKRTADGTAWSYAFKRHWGHTLAGLVWGILIWWLDPITFWWFVPVFAGMTFSMPFSVFTSRSRLGARTRGMGLFLTPEETSPPPELDTLRVRMASMAGAGETAERPPDYGLAEIVLDLTSTPSTSRSFARKIEPGLCRGPRALGRGPARSAPARREIAVNGPEVLKHEEKVLIMSDADTMSWLHRQIWIRPGGRSPLVAGRHPPERPLIALSVQGHTAPDIGRHIQVLP